MSVSRFLEKIRLKIKKLYFRNTASIRQKKIHNKDFTIISNNCWGGLVYQSYGLPYQSPTAGLFILPDDYVKFVKDLKKYLSKKLEFIKPDESKWRALLGEDFDYPVARLGDIEIYFVHYKTAEEAKEKWERRAKRVNYDKVIYKMSDQNFCKKQNLEEFVRLPMKNKVCFVSKNYGINDTIRVKGVMATDDKAGGLWASREPMGHSHLIDLNKVVNEL